MPATPNSYILPQSSRVKAAVLTADKTSHANSTDAVKIADAGTNGSIVTKAWVIPRDTQNSTKVALYWSPDNGTTMYLLETVDTPAYTQADDTAQAMTAFTCLSAETPLPLPASHSLWAGAFVALAAGFVVNAFIEDY